MYLEPMPNGPGPHLDLESLFGKKRIGYIDFIAYTTIVSIIIRSPTVDAVPTVPFIKHPLNPRRLFQL